VIRIAQLALGALFVCFLAAAIASCGCMVFEVC
jgi:hypothetical protein